ncbi:MAG: hypothetical protein K6T65_15890 [Peptococcaceae bacterium]|nr:hypothetical protein [Peptococcaceae bacterium]
MIKKIKKKSAERNVKRKKYFIYTTAGCSCILLLTLILTIFVSRGGNAGGRPLPAGPETALNKPLDLRELVEFRKRDQVLIDELISDPDEKRRGDKALKQWEALWPCYLAWSEQYTMAEGIKIYGPRASAWLNEILWAMIQREDMVHGSTNKWASKPPRERAPKADHWFSLGGLDGDPYDWAAFEEEKGMQILTMSDGEVTEKAKSVLANIQFPFSSGVFKDVEIYVYPSHALFSNKTTKGMYNPAITSDRCYTPVAGDYGKPNVIRVIIAGIENIDKERTVPHELAHAWFRVMQKHGGKGILSAWAKNRAPFIPADVDPESLSDEYKAVGGWGDRVEEVMAEDFADVFFAGESKETMRHSWPKITSPQVLARLMEFFAIHPQTVGELNVQPDLHINPVPRLVRGDNINITGKAKPGREVRASTKFASSSVAIGSDGNFSINISLEGLKKNAKLMEVEMEIPQAGVKHSKYVGETLPVVTVASGDFKLSLAIDPRE